MNYALWHVSPHTHVSWLSPKLCLWMTCLSKLYIYYISAGPRSSIVAKEPEHKLRHGHSSFSKSLPCGTAIRDLDDSARWLLSLNMIDGRTDNKGNININPKAVIQGGCFGSSNPKNWQSRDTHTRREIRVIQPQTCTTVAQYRYKE